MHKVITLASLVVGVSSLADILPDSLPIVAPYSPGFSELTYSIALTSSQRILTGDEFVILDVDNFSFWDVPPGAVFALTTELLTPFSTVFGGGIIAPPDDPTKLNLRFTYTDPLAIDGPVPFTPLTGLIFEESFQLVLRANNFAAHTHQTLALGGLPTVNVASVYVPQQIPEASTWSAIAMIGGLALWQFRRR